MGYGSIKAFIRRDGERYTAECMEVDVAAEGDTLDETVENLRAELCRTLDGADFQALGLDPEPVLFITMEDVPLGLPLACRHEC